MVYFPLENCCLLSVFFSSVLASVFVSVLELLFSVLELDDEPEPEDDDDWEEEDDPDEVEDDDEAEVDGGGDVAPEAAPLVGGGAAAAG